MAFDNDLIAGKLRRWEQYLNSFLLPDWNEIPNIGLYMEQVIVLLKDYLDYLPPELKEEQIITAATINNYVRTNVMPKPIKKRYYRIHIAYLIMICTLKQNLSISMISEILPPDKDEVEMEKFYQAFAARHRETIRFFGAEARAVAGKILKHDETPPIAADCTEDLIISAAVIGGFTRLFAEKLILLKDHTIDDGDDISIVERPRRTNNRS